MQPYELPLTEASAALASGELTPLELTQSALARIDAVEPRVHAFATVTADLALEQAERATAEIRQGRHRGPLHGIPVGIKDLINTAGVPTTASSKVRQHHIPDSDAAVVQKLADAGMVMVGKTHTHEFAYGGVTPTTFNPWDLTRMTGGSSGGSAAAIAYGGVLVALGSDTGGSIRIPASFCGTVGLKPTYGRVSRTGVASLAWSLDHVGPLTRNVTDAALVLNAIAGYDPRDTGSANRAVPDFTDGIDDGVHALRIGVPTNFFTEDLDADTDQAVRTAVRVLEDQGAVVVPVEIPHVEHLGAVIAGIMMPEASAYHRRALRETPELFTEQVRGLLEVGETILATDYIDALRFRQLMKEGWKELMRSVDVIIAPTVLCPALPAEDTERSRPDGSSEDAGVEFGRLSIPANLFGLPSLQVPCGFSADGLPLGLQIMGRPFAEQTVLRVGRAYERVGDAVGRIAPL
ncbi:amidase [Arthrobacter sp. RIT-PI-e]|uniref:amidase n=1 Tax=Arthrobacter sp. RIT-PI-e TaxID=1681197 RepID=UPI00067699F9|nr:amidase [Arthrobacter sp. RIT-PI-e]KNC19759.1 amidase [Arthrobacter sp. RIT-PI-e]